MWQRIKCFFGVHDEFQHVTSHSWRTHYRCVHCGKYAVVLTLIYQEYKKIGKLGKLLNAVND